MKYLFLSNHAHLPRRIGTTTPHRHDPRLSFPEHGHTVGPVAGAPVAPAERAGQAAAGAGR